MYANMHRLYILYVKTNTLGGFWTVHGVKTGYVLQCIQFQKSGLDFHIFSLENLHIVSEMLCVCRQRDGKGTLEY